MAKMVKGMLKGSYEIRSPLFYLRARPRIRFLFFPRAARVPRARAAHVSEANQQYHFKSSRCGMKLLCTDSCRRTVPMEPPISNGSMRHREPKSEIDDPGHSLQGASCTIAAMVQEAPLKIYARGVVSYFYFFRAPPVCVLKSMQINSAILKVPDGALNRWIRIPAAEQFPWNLRCLTAQCAIGNLKVKSMIRVFSCRGLLVP